MPRPLRRLVDHLRDESRTLVPFSQMNTAGCFIAEPIPCCHSTVVPKDPGPTDCLLLRGPYCGVSGQRAAAVDVGVCRSGASSLDRVVPAVALTR